MSKPSELSDISQARARADGDQARDKARAVRRARARGLILRLAVWVVVPTVASIIYYGLWASSQYQSVSVFSVQSNERTIGFDALAAIMPASSSTRDAMVVREHILSRDMLAKLNQTDGFIDHFQDSKADYFSRLDTEASLEAVYAYYLDHVQVTYSSQSGALTLTVRAYSGERARAFARQITTLAEDMVNHMSERAQQDRVRFAKAEVATAEQRLAKSRGVLLKLQGEGADLNPTASASAVLSVRSGLEGKLAQARADFDAARTLMQDDSPRVMELRGRVSSLVRQIKQQNRRLTNGKDGSINASIARFEPALIEKEMAQQSLEAALQALALSRVEAMRQQRYLVTIAQASLPDEATHPRKLWGIVTVFVLGLSMMVVFTLLVATVREHAKF